MSDGQFYLLCFIVTLTNAAICYAVFASLSDRITHLQRAARAAHNRLDDHIKKHRYDKIQRKHRTLAQQHG